MKDRIKVSPGQKQDDDCDGGNVDDMTITQSSCMTAAQCAFCRWERLT